MTTWPEAWRRARAFVMPERNQIGWRTVVVSLLLWAFLADVIYTVYQLIQSAIH